MRHLKIYTNSVLWELCIMFNYSQYAHIQLKFIEFFTVLGSDFSSTDQTITRPYFLVYVYWSNIFRFLLIYMLLITGNVCFFILLLCNGHGKVKQNNYRLLLWITRSFCFLSNFLWMQVSMSFKQKYFPYGLVSRWNTLYYYTVCKWIFSKFLLEKHDTN